MTYSLQASISPEGRIACTLASTGAPLESPVFCFSLMVPPRVVSGGTLLESLGGWGAVRLDGTLTRENPLRFELTHVTGHRAGNRAWLPLSPYLRLPGGKTAPVSTGPLGVLSPNVAALVPTGLGLVPVPAHWSPAGGTAMAPAFVPAGGWQADRDAAAALCNRIGQPPLFAATGMPLALSVADMGVEAYRLAIAPDGVMLEAASASGAFHGLISLIVLRAVHLGALPTGVIEDKPRFAWRGQHLDCARHFFRTGSITRLLDLMALLKLNRFHWHFADDEAFRLEVDCAPDLWRRSAFRGEGQTLPGLFGGGCGPTGGTYSKAEARTVVQHAAALRIEVLPEIEVPAHALAITEIYPELRDPKDIGTETSVQGYGRNTVNPALPTTWELLEPLAREVANQFPFGHLHIGGDELPDRTWSGSPAVDALKRQHGLKTHEDVQGHTMERLASVLSRNGVTACAWQEAALGCQGGIGHDAILFSWTGQGPGLEAARRGYRVVMCPAQHTYWDMARTADPNDWGANWAANFGLADTLAWDPVPTDEPELAAVILGVEGAFWGEFTTEDSQMEAMIAPRILGLSVMGWSERGACDPARLKELARGFQSLFAPMGWQVNGHELI